jgi:hypothetical protein
MEVLMGGVLPWTPGLPGEKISAMGKSIAQRSQRGMGSGRLK